MAPAAADSADAKADRPRKEKTLEGEKKKKRKGRNKKCRNHNKIIHGRLGENLHDIFIKYFD